MAIRQDRVQLNIDFITDESRQLADTLLKTKQYNQEIDASSAKIKKYQQDLAAVKNDEKARTTVLEKIAAEEKKIGDNLKNIVDQGKKVEKLDLNKLAPAQLIERAKQLQQTIRLIPQSAPEFKDLQTELSRVNAQIASIRNTSKGIEATKGFGMGALANFAGKAGLAIGGAVGAISTFFSSLSNKAKLEQTNIAFETFLGNAESAKKLIADLRAFEVKTPFEADQVFDAAKAFLAFGFSQSEIIPTLEKVGTVAAATGKDFNELALIFGKARAEGLIQNDTLGQLAEAGIPIYEELSKVLKVNQSEIRKLAENGKIQFSDLQKAFSNLTGEGGRFNGLLQRQSESLNGLFSTLSGIFKSSLNSVVGAFIPLIKDATKGSISFLSVPVSETLEKERLSFIGVTAQIYGANEGSKERARLIGDLQKQYPEYLAGIDAERATNEQLKPILDSINNSYIVRIALQKQQEKIAPLIEREADAALDLANVRVRFNRDLARGAEIAQINLATFQSEAEAIAAVQKALQDRIAGRGFSFFAQEDQKVLSNILGYTKTIEFQTNRQSTAAKQVGEAEKTRLEVVDQLRKTYGELVDKVIAGPANTGNKTVVDTISPKNSAEEAKKRIDQAFETAQKAVEAETRRRELFLEAERIKGLVTEAQYLEQLSKIQEDGLRKSLEVYRNFKRERENEAIALQNRLLEIEEARRSRQPLAAPAAIREVIPGVVPDRTSQTLEVAGIGAAASQKILKQRFEEALISEQEYELSRLQLKRLFINEELAILREATVLNVDEIRKREEQKRDIEADIDEQRLENQRRTESIRQDTISAGFAATQSLFSAVSDLLLQDTNARKKHATAIKLFQRGEVIVSGIAEASKIRASVASYLFPANILIGAAQSLAVGFRTATALAKIDAAKFAGGGHTGPGFGIPDETGFRPAGVVHSNEYVIPKWQVQHPQYRPIVDFLEEGRLRGYADGGFVTTNTTPSFPPGFTFTPYGGETYRIEEAARRFESAVLRMPARIRAEVVYTDIEDAGKNLSDIRSAASF